ncbi:E3 ubiquitin-protein ligase RNF14-like [Panicum miliaceum]|uniref:E3 ubiquitin-protein ligase RNF14-like n=1 Tax=Panicum miliaceum TaxID=4540 RepID=A0A3L6PWW1_PANMI|nr:E3 ubiquitin-protein ligase RNF14-like [Panicum miliaceum]
MAAAAFTGTASRRIPEPHLSGRFSDETSSSSSTSDCAESSAVACEGGGEAEEGLLDLDSPWVAAAEAESRLEAAATAVAAGLGYRAEDGHEEEEDEIRDNQQWQEDELMALEAIYGDDLVVFENKGRLRYFQIYIRYDVADGVKVCAKLSAPNASTGDVGCFDGSEHDYGPDEFSYTCNFEYPPPLILTCLLPKSYPSKEPQSFAIIAKWMDGPYVSQLCEMLDTIWAELSGQEVVYQWVEWLRDSSRSYLWIDGSMTLGPDIATRNTDNRAIPRTKSLESVIPLMLSYRSKKRYQAFLEDLHICMICLNQTKVCSPITDFNIKTVEKSASLTLTPTSEKRYQSSVIPLFRGPHTHTITMRFSPGHQYGRLTLYKETQLLYSQPNNPYTFYVATLPYSTHVI